MGDEEADLDGLNRRCNVVDATLSSKKRRMSDNASEMAEEDCERTGGAELVLGDLEFKPLYLISVWNEPTTTTNCVTLAIVLPSGTGCGNFSCRVVDGGEYVELTVGWPSPLINIETMHRKWLQVDSQDDFKLYHPKVIGFQNALKTMRMRSSDKIESTARIPLPFAVQTHIYGKHNLAWREGTTLMVYLDLKAVVEEYAILNDSESFEVL